MTLKNIYYIQRDGLKMDPLHPLLQWSLRISRVPVGPSPTTVKKSVEQITLVLTDVRKTALDLHIEKNEPRALLNSIKSMLNTLSEHLYSERYEHAFGLLRLDSRIEMICPITQYQYQFEKAIDGVQYRKHDSDRLYEAIMTAVDCIMTYQRQNCSGHDKPHKLIICITNGINNNGSVNFKSLQQKVRRNKIKMDMISFLSDPRRLDFVKKHEVLFIKPNIFPRLNLHLSLHKVPAYGLVNGLTMASLPANTQNGMYPMMLKSSKATASTEKNDEVFIVDCI
jgi:hypothetical protein